MFLSQLFEGGVKDIDIARQDRDTMSPQQFYGQYGQTRDDWTNAHKGIMTPPKKPRKPRQPVVKNYEAWGYKYNSRDQREMWREYFASEEAAKRYAENNRIDLMGVKKI